MITDNAKRVLSVLCLLCLLFTLLSCRTDSDLPTLHSLSNSEGEDFGTPIAEYYTLVLPAEAGEALAARAKELAEAIAQKTGVPTEVIYDNETIPKRNNARLILLGNTKFSLSSLYLSNLRRDDYVCVLDDTTLILGGKSDGATLAAIDRFWHEVLPYADAEILINHDRFFTVRASYEIKSVTLNGYSLADYTLVYPSKDENAEKQIAYALREALADRCGFYPDIVSNKKLQNPVRMIAVGDCFNVANPETPSIRADGSLISLCGATPYELACTAEALCHLLTEPEADNSVTLNLSESVSVSCPPCEQNVSPFLLNVSNTTSPTDLPEIAATSTALRNQSITLASFGSMTVAFYECLSENLSDYTAYVTELSQTHCLPLYYAPDQLSLSNVTALDSDVGIALAFDFLLPNTSLSFTLIQLYAENPENAQTLLDLATQYACTQSKPTVMVLHSPSIPDEEFSSKHFSVSATVNGTQEDAFIACTKSDGVACSLNERADGLHLQFIHPYLR